MKVIIIGLGIQGKKRKFFVGKDFVYSVDNRIDEAGFASVEDVPLHEYDAALCCTPDSAKYDIIEYLLSHKKHVLVEKPLFVGSVERLKHLEALANQNNVLCYTAYNHRFEPHFQRVKEDIDSGKLGRIYTCRLFYGNGTARDVRNSEWRDKGLSVIPDLGSHLLDTCGYWFPDKKFDFCLDYCNNYENKSPDHAIISSFNNGVHVELEMALLMWENHFTCDILAERGSVHISSLCKWGPATYSYRIRQLPSGRPMEDNITLEQKDPTWEAEYKFFVDQCTFGAKTDLANDIMIQTVISNMDKAYHGKN